MTEKLKFIWIDDARQRRSSAKSLAINLNITVDFISIENKNVQDEIEKSVNWNDADLIIIDHKLHKNKDSIIRTGSTVAELIREILPDCPMVCVSAVDIDHDISQAQRDLYDDVFSFPKLQKHYDTLEVIAKSYKYMTLNRPKNQDEIIKLLKGPDSEKDRLLTILPRHLKEKFNDKSLLQRISKWVRFILFKTPGFLYDELWTSTLIGIKHGSFQKVSNIFKGANYKGIFSDPSDLRWWAANVKEILYEKVKDEKYRRPWELGQRLKGCSEKDRSICYACGEAFPEIVAFVDETGIKQAPMHLRCTIRHPNYQPMLFFDEVRVMKGAGN